MTYETLSVGFDYGMRRGSESSHRPMLLLLGNSIAGTFTPPLSEIGDLLLAAPNPWCVVTLDLPCHGAYLPNSVSGEINGWRTLANSSYDFVTPFLYRVSDVVSDMRSRGIAHPSKCAVAGISRGGFMALHVAQAGIMANIACVSPVTKLTALSEFAVWTGAEPHALNAAALWPTSVHMTISNRDSRVGTDACIAFTQSLIAAQKAHRASDNVDVTLKVATNPIGHDGHEQIPGAPLEAAQWILNVWGEQPIP